MSRQAPVSFAPDYTTSPGEYLQDLLTQRGESQSDLAARTGISPKHINQIIKGQASVSPDTAVQLDLATGISAEMWSSYEAIYRSHLATAQARSRLAQWQGWLKNFNLSELHKRGILPTNKTNDDQVETMLRFFGIADPSGWKRVWEPNFVSFRQSPAFEPHQPATSAWLRIGQLKAAQTEVETYDANALRALLPEVRALTTQTPADFLQSLPILLAQAGVAVVYASGLDGCRASGATWWSSPTKAVILLSDRGKREDRFWFSCLHEIGHVLLHPKRSTFLDQKRSDDKDDGPPWDDPPPAPSVYIDSDAKIDGRSATIESEADDFAAHTLIPAEIDQQIGSLSKESEIIELAARLNVSPGIVAGRWQYQRSDFSKFNRLRRPLPIGPFLQPPPLLSPA